MIVLGLVFENTTLPGVSLQAHVAVQRVSLFSHRKFLRSDVNES